jgi:hypothetical protein
MKFTRTLCGRRFRCSRPTRNWRAVGADAPPGGPAPIQQVPRTAPASEQPKPCAWAGYSQRDSG